MKIAFFLVSACSLLLLGCESYQNQNIQEQQEAEDKKPQETRVEPVPAPEHGGGAGNR